MRILSAITKINGKTHLRIDAENRTFDRVLGSGDQPPD